MKNASKLECKTKNPRQSKFPCTSHISTNSVIYHFTWHVKILIAIYNPHLRIRLSVPNELVACSFLVMNYKFVVIFCCWKQIIDSISEQMMFKNFNKSIQLNQSQQDTRNSIQFKNNKEKPKTKSIFAKKKDNV